MARFRQRQRQRLNKFPERPIRRSQLISPFGVGAMVDFRNDESLMTAGLDAWPKAREPCPTEWKVIEERLQSRLGLDHFRLPPDFRSEGELARESVPYIRFPRWHYCPKCGSMEKLSIYGSRTRCSGRKGTICDGSKDTLRPFLIPVRIVAVCPQGHIEDFPFHAWVHDGQTIEENEHSLRFLAGRSSASLAGIKISCSCGKSRSLAGAFGFDEQDGGPLHQLGQDCTSQRPWVGDDKPDQTSCGQNLRVVQRGASNVYFPVVASSIYLPLWGEKAKRAVIKVLENDKYWSVLSSGIDGEGRISVERCKTVAELTGVDANELFEAAQMKLDGSVDAGQEQSEEDYRRQEFEALRTGRGGEATELFVDLLDGTDYGAASRFLGQVGLVKKLRETRVLTGFSRLLPAPDSSAPEAQALSLDNSLRWLPANVVRGEGIFLEFCRDVAEEWRSKPSVQSRVEGLISSYNQRRIERGLAERELDATFVLLHTFAHALIAELSYSCGYGSASLRERLYWSPADRSDPMMGALIYTASGDSEGTLGGLVQQGEPDKLPATISEALRKSEWCSSDPVCIESTGQGIDNANLAACHGCVLLPETSCEEGNRLLDRASLVGQPTNAEISFFGGL